MDDERPRRRTPGMGQLRQLRRVGRCFVLRSPDRAGYCAAVLLKRGARTPEDVDRLRALLDRHLPRV
ncbi:hypothetical protein AB0N14_05580 [Streptomyces sp. NPDC051104]|uniref:hypothetical protein n=1 Tax=Streptomyces sp. NPDC051104 TaxID=3155044 RepID=UPI003415C184